MMGDEEKTIFTILEDGRTVTMFTAPGNVYAARQLWVFLVENLRPGLEVTLSHKHVQLRRDSGRKITPELYRRIMDMERSPDTRGES